MKPLGPKQKRALEVAGVAGLVLLVVMLAKRQNAAAGGDTAGVTAPGAIDPATGQPADFSGDQSGNLSDIANTWAGALGDLGTGVSQLGANQQELASGLQGVGDSVVTLGGSLADTQASVDALTAQLQSGAFAPASAGTPGTASVTRKATSVPTTKTVVKRSAAHGGALSVYHVTPGKKPVYVRPASAAAKAKAKPAKKTTVHKPAPKKPAATHRSPSQTPRGHKPAPPRRKSHR